MNSVGNIGNKRAKKKNNNNNKQNKTKQANPTIQEVFKHKLKDPLNYFAVPS